MMVFPNGISSRYPKLSDLEPCGDDLPEPSARRSRALSGQGLAAGSVFFQALGVFQKSDPFITYFLKIVWGLV